MPSNSTSTGIPVPPKLNSIEGLKEAVAQDIEAVYRYILQLRAEVHRVNIELYETSVREKGLLHMIELEANRQARLPEDFEKVLHLLETSIKHSTAIDGAPSPEDSKPQSS